MRRAALAAALAASALGLAVPGTASAARGMEIGVQDDAVFLFRAWYDRGRALEQARQLGVTRIRVNIGWARALGSDADASSPPERPTYHFAAWDDVIDAAAAHGIRVQLTLVPPAPVWATGDGEIGEERPDARQFGRFARAAATHFRGRVDRYAIWNEPNHVGWLTPQSQAPTLYRELYREGYKNVKRADAAATVLLGELVPFKNGNRSSAPLRFLRDLTCTRVAGPAPSRGAPRLRKSRSCPSLRADGVAHHPYDYLGPPERRYPGQDNVTIGTLDRLTGTLDELDRLKLLRNRGGDPPEVYLTEFGYFAAGRNRHPDARRASYLRRAYRLAQRDPHVRQIAQYLLVKPPQTAAGSYFDMSLVTLDGRTTAPFDAIASWSRSAARRGMVVAPGAPIQLAPRPAAGS